MSEFNETNELPRAISEEDTIIEAEITHSGSDQESTTKIDLKSSTDVDVDDEHLDAKAPVSKKSNSPSEPISTLCFTMRRQIISRSDFFSSHHLNSPFQTKTNRSSPIYHFNIVLKSIDPEQLL